VDSSSPVQDICEPQSPAYSFGETKNLQFCLLQTLVRISDSLRFAATPPTMRSSFFLVNDKARSVASPIIEKAVSCNEKHASSRLLEIICLVAERRPENDTSFPFTTYGREM